MQLRSHAHIECILNGHRVIGWAEEDPPYEFEYEDAAEYVEGHDGGLYGLGRPRLGGTFMLKLQPTSPTTQWAVKQEQERKNAHKEKRALRVYSGSISDPVQGVEATLSGGGIIMIPAFPIANQTFEVRFMFEEIESSVDGGTFHPPRMSDAS